jgi:capsular exopolysaccharide synthesis family protein
MDIYSIENNQQEMTIDLKKYLFLFWQWAWLIIIVTVLAGTAAYFLSRRITPTYQASATALVQVPSVNITDYSATITSEYLSRTYSQIMTNTSVMEETISQLSLQMSPQQLAGMITVQEVQNSQLIRLSVVSTNPQLAARIANTVIEVFSSEIQEQQTKRFALSKSSLETRMADIENQINEFGNQLQNATTDEDIDRIETKIAQYQGIFSTLLNSYEQIRLSEAQTMTSVTLIEPANVPNSPFRPRVLMNTALAGLTGFLLTAGAIFALEAMDDTIKTPDDIKHRLDLPVLGIIDSFSQGDNNGGGLIAVKMPRSPITESFRTLRTNVQFASIDRDLKSLLVTSAEPTEGKTTIAANLAVVFAQSGRKTVIIDADMRRPDVHKKFDISNSEGLTSIFYRKIDNQIKGEDKIVKSPIDNLQILTSGKLPPNPSEILASVKMKRLIERIKADNDVLIIDSPPILAVTDAVILSPLVDGVLIVVAPGKTTFTAAKNMIEQLQRSKARILGVVIKFMDGRGKRYARRYGYATRSHYEHYYKSDDE